MYYTVVYIIYVWARARGLNIRFIEQPTIIYYYYYYWLLIVIDTSHVSVYRSRLGNAF